MTATVSTDVVVIGLGPAGATAAAAAAGSGLRVLGIDRKRVAGLPVQCAEFVPGPTASICNLKQAKRQSIESMVTMVADGPVHITSGFRGSMIDRAAFDGMLVDQAQRAGAQIMLGTGVASLDGGCVELNDGRRVDAAVIIGADGPRSIVGKAIGAVNLEIAETRQITVPLRSSHAATDIFLGADYPGGYAWLFPVQAVAHLGIGLASSHRGHLKPLLERLHARLIAEGRLEPEILKRTGGAIPVGGMLDPVAEIDGRAVLLAGDAAGLAHPITGAGIASAVQSGAMAGRAAGAIRRGVGGALQDYADELADLFAAALHHACKRREELLRSWRLPSGPTTAELRRGWIAFPEYWIRDVLQSPPMQKGSR